MEVMEKTLNPFYSNPVATLIGSLVISVAILMHGGIIKIGQPVSNTPAGQQAAVTPAAQPTVTQDAIKALFTDKNITFGDVNSKNLLIEVADPSCPYCHIAAGKNPTLNKSAGSQFILVSDGGKYVAPVPEMKKLVDEGRAGFVWIYTNGHGNGEMGTKALYCAHEKGNFWQVHDKLMSTEGYDMLNTTIKNDKSKSQELATFLSGSTDVAAMKACLDSGKYDPKLAEDSSVAASLGVNGTPGFFVNTKNFAGAYSWADMQSALQ